MLITLNFDYRLGTRSHGASTATESCLNAAWADFPLSQSHKFIPTFSKKKTSKHKKTTVKESENNENVFQNKESPPESANKESKGEGLKGIKMPLAEKQSEGIEEEKNINTHILPPEDSHSKLTQEGTEVCLKVKQSEGRAGDIERKSDKTSIISEIPDIKEDVLDKPKDGDQVRNDGNVRQMEDIHFKDKHKASAIDVYLNMEKSGKTKEVNVDYAEEENDEISVTPPDHVIPMPLDGNNYRQSTPVAGDDADGVANPDITPVRFSSPDNLAMVQSELEYSDLETTANILMDSTRLTTSATSETDLIIKKIDLILQSDEKKEYCEDKSVQNIVLENISATEELKDKIISMHSEVTVTSDGEVQMESSVTSILDQNPEKHTTSDQNEAKTLTSDQDAAKTFSSDQNEANTLISKQNEANTLISDQNEGNTLISDQNEARTLTSDQDGKTLEQKEGVAFIDSYVRSLTCDSVEDSDIQPMNPSQLFSRYQKTNEYKSENATIKYEYDVYSTKQAETMSTHKLAQDNDVETTEKGKFEKCDDPHGGDKKSRRREEVRSEDVTAHVDIRHVVDGKLPEDAQNVETGENKDTD